MSVLLLLAIFSLVAALIGCGVPGEPLPPLLEIPAPIQDLKANQVGDRLELTWTPPTMTTEGTRVRELEAVVLHGDFFPSSAPPDEAAAQLGILATFSSKDDTGAPLLRNRYALSLPQSRRGQRGYFALTAINRRGKDAGGSNVASIEIADLPEPPTNLSATVTEPAIELRWTPSDKSVFGGPAPKVDGYEIYRADSGSAAPAQLLGTTADSSYEDKILAFGSRYVYTVRAFVHRGDSTARTPESSRVEVAAVDTFPPAAPQNLSGIAVPGAVELSWSPNNEPDLAGYNVYRSEGGAFVRLNSELIPLPLFRDVSAQPGTAYRYVIKALDKTGNESFPSREAPVTAE